MKADRSAAHWKIWDLASPLETAILVGVAASVSYFAPKMLGALLLNPERVWAMWPGCALLVPILLLAPRIIWPILIPTALAAFSVYDLQAGVPVRSIAWFMLADTVQVLIAALSLSYLFDGVPQLTSVKALARYLFCAAILAPSISALLSAPGIGTSYWEGWRIAFFSEVLAFLTVTPAILSWAGRRQRWMRKSRNYPVEMIALIGGLMIAGYITFTGSPGSNSPAKLYSLVPFLIWSALRLGSVGTSSAVLVISILSIWGAIHGRGPFVEGERLSNVFSIQLFLVFTATPFMVLAALVEERKSTEEALRKSDERLSLAVQAGRMYAFEWDAASDAIVRSAESTAILNWIEDPIHDTGRQFIDRVHPRDRESYAAPESGLTSEHSTYQTTYRVLRPDGTVLWLEARGRASFNERGKMLGIVGMVADVTARKEAEEDLLELGGRLIHAHEEEYARIARELHDDLSQRLAVLQLIADQFRQDSAGLSSGAQQKLIEVVELIDECASGFHNISHHLHPSTLDTLGLVNALRCFCKDFSNQHQFPVEFVSQNVPDRLSNDVSLCLYRIAQEALRNAVKHSGAAEARVELTHRGEQIDLCISDAGTGFDPASVKGGGLGLISMRERLRSLGGKLLIEAQGSEGTRIHALVPMSATALQRTDS